MIPYGRQDIDDDDVAAVVAVLRSDFLTQGPAITAFENMVARYVGAPHAVAACNATAGLQIAYLSLGLSAGSRSRTGRAARAVALISQPKSRPAGYLP